MGGIELRLRETECLGQVRRWSWARVRSALARWTPDSTCQRLGVRPDEVVFLDDLEANMVAAHEVGMHAVHFRDTTRPSPRWMPSWQTGACQPR
jgi:hypothetical protein